MVRHQNKAKYAPLLRTYAGEIISEGRLGFDPLNTILCTEYSTEYVLYMLDHEVPVVSIQAIPITWTQIHWEVRHRREQQPDGRRR